VRHSRTACRNSPYATGRQAGWRVRPRCWWVRPRGHPDMSRGPATGRRTLRSAERTSGATRYLRVRRHRLRVVCQNPHSDTLVTSPTGAIHARHSRPRHPSRRPGPPAQIIGCVRTRDRTPTTSVHCGHPRPRILGSPRLRDYGTGLRFGRTLTQNR
jgi:hypothetical protein